MIKVAKFGGSSMADALRFRMVRSIVNDDPGRVCVVVSACGKRNKQDNKITDLLYLIQAHRQYGVSYDEIFNTIRERYKDIAAELRLKFDLDAEFDAILEKLKGDIDVDYLVSRGEYLTARLMAEYLRYAFVDAADTVFFNYDGKVNMEKTTAALSEAARKYGRFVLPGFYGTLPNGRIRLFSRGGSDITGAIAANALDADCYENWTDVSGILMADPRVVDNPRPIKQITYEELRELSFMGASVLHEEAVLPVKEKGIPLNIRNTIRPEDKGTLILNSIDEEPEGDHLLTGIAGRKGFTVMTLYKKQITTDTLIVRRTLEILEACHVEVQHITLGVDSFNVVMPTAQVSDRIYDIVSEIRSTLSPDDVKIQDNIALIASVGRRMVSVPGSSARLFGALGANNINIRMIAQGSEEISIIVGVENRDFERTIRTLYEGFMDREESNA